MNTTERPGVVALVTDALGRSADLIQTEIRLARVELGEKAEALRTSLVSGIVMMLVGTVFMIGALILVLQALVAALIESGVTPAVAILVVAGGSAVGGIVILMAGKKTLGAVDPTPTRTITSLKNDARMAKENLT
ncbi:phage holin family protein [Reyranella sp. MMS21-HV4-11]|uniref:Phage holin family protein n=1 Tax=Reyranella humidisoli TaxID=2849149 RepID=A0ABS6III5_9HYPH|nr:phage holin family protein [Reyranella sp. MMS21-HV4-11]MBU8873060.1 phage holin family protein [Reyranella sp. MMS21-HV4-11]